MAAPICAIFWDYENTQIPRDFAADPKKAVANVMTAVRDEFQLQVESKVYCKSTALPRKHHEAMQDHGMAVVDPHIQEKHRKEVVDVRIIADMGIFLASCVERRPRPAKVVLITTDGDYSYMLSRMRDYGVETVVFTCRVDGRLDVATDVRLWHESSRPLLRETPRPMRRCGRTCPPWPLSTRRTPTLTPTPTRRTLCTRWTARGPT